jgi:hypothetical protein
MGFSFWVGITIGGVISVLASFAANLFHSRMVDFLDSRKLGFQERRRKSALRLHRVIGSLHSGKRDKYIYMLWLSGAVWGSFLTGIVALAAATIIASLGLPPPDVSVVSVLVDPVSKTRLLSAFAMMFMSTFGIFNTLYSMRRFREITEALDNFEKYEADFREKWGKETI